MPAKGRTKLLTGAWTVVGLCLTCLGCQTQLSYSYKDGPVTTVTMSTLKPLKPVEEVEPVAQVAAQATPEPEVVRAASSAPVPAPVPAACAPGGMPNGPVQGELAPPGLTEGPIPTELAKVSMPSYVIEPPDILLLDPIRLVPKPPYRIEAFDQLVIQVSNTLPDQPISGIYQVTPDGTISLGFSYGTVRVGGLTIEEVEAAIRSQLGRVLQSPQVSVALREFRGLQQTRGEHLVRPDGTISLGGYGCVYVAGMTLAQAKGAIEAHLANYLDRPQVSVDVFAYNSKVYYVIADGGGYGQLVYRFPITGNETVLDAIGNINGLPSVASRKKIWVARPAPAHWGCDQVLPVDWHAITQGGSTGTNYQLFPGDRIYVKADPLIAIDNALAKVLSPIERIFGITLLGSATVRSFEGNGGGGGGFFIAP
jgi:polysaccharide biosynthesis/export protein